MQHLVFKLYAPLAAWGEQAVGGVRPSAVHPSCSAVMGMLAAALGLKREQEEEHLNLAAALGVGVKMISPGVILQDFHTAQVAMTDKKREFYCRRDEFRPGNTVHTVLSQREYREDALAVVAVWLKGTGGLSLDQLKSALDYPVFQLYLGRKSCPPALPLDAQVLEAKTLKEALDSPHLDFSGFDGFFEDNKPAYFWEEHPEAGLEVMSRAPRYDRVLSRVRWQHSRREEYSGTGEQGGG